MAALSSTLRGMTARALPRGYREEVADEVRSTLAHPGTAHRAAIDRIVARAATTVPFYRELGPRPLEELPVVRKALLVERREEFLAPPAGLGPLTVRHSSGSSGIPFESVIDEARMVRHRGELVGAYRYLGADPFGPLLHCRPWFTAGRRQRASSALRGQHLYSGEEDAAAVRRVATWLRRHPGAAVIGLCTFLARLLRRFEELGEEIPPGTVRVVLGVGEPPSQYLREASPRMLGVPLALRYSNTENGLLGFARGGESCYHLDSSTFHVEVLDEHADVPAAPGARGRIVVTDLFNRAMPFLRYDTGDLGRLALDAEGRPLPGVLAELSGRGSDVLLGGTPCAPRRADHFALFMRADSLPGFRQRQRRRHAVPRCPGVLDAERGPALEDALRRLLEAAVGPVESCRVEYRTGLPVETSGKRRFLVSEIEDPEALLRAAAPPAR